MKLIPEVTKRGENIQLLMDSGKSFNKANQEVTAFYKEKGLQADRSGGFRPAFYDFLREGIKTEPQVVDFIKDNGSDYDNKPASVSHYKSIWQLAEDVRK